MKSIRRALVLTVTLVLCSPAIVADQTDDRLEGLFEMLRDSQDAEELIEVEANIWEIWYAAAETIYASVIEQAPTFSEGWNRRATVRFYQRDYDGSLHDIEQTLKLEPRHFGAIWGLGMILGVQQDYERAIIAFEKLLEIKPNASDARPRIELLKQELARQSV
jgi:tetratricopeptide (TPR) repeat protein